MIRVYRHGSVWARFEFKLEDFWIGAFWRREAARWDIWVCLIPCFPLHLTWWDE